MQIYNQEFQEGWKNFESRWFYSKYKHKPFKSSKNLLSNISKEKNVFVWAEQGIGDQIMYGSMFSEIANLSKKAKELNLEVLLEVHNNDELKKGLVENVDIIGVNNRNLKSFKTDLKISEKLFNEIPNEFLKISESGLNNDNSIKKLKKIGYQGFLIGEKFMISSDPGKELKKTLENLTYEN